MLNSTYTVVAPSAIVWAIEIGILGVIIGVPILLFRLQRAQIGKFNAGHYGRGMERLFRVGRRITRFGVMRSLEADEWYDVQSYIIALSAFAREDYDTFFKNIQLLKLYEFRKSSWLALYYLVVQKDVQTAQVYYNATAIAQDSSSISETLPILEAAFLYEQGEREAAVLMFQEAEKNSHLAASHKIIRHYLDESQKDT